MSEQYHLTVTSDAPITVRASSIIKGRLRVSDIVVSEFKFLVERQPDDTYRFATIDAKLTEE